MGEKEQVDAFLEWMDQLADSIDEVSLQYREGAMTMQEAKNTIFYNVVIANMFIKNP